jgi:hypothetical protein
MDKKSWMQVYLEKLDGNEVCCPTRLCSDVRWKFAGDPVTRIGFAIVWCNDCLKGAHFSRVVIPHDIEFDSFADSTSFTNGLPEIQFVDDPRLS